MFTNPSIEKFLRKLAGIADLEGALRKLDRLTQEEARMALAEVLRITHSVRDEVKVVDSKVEDVGDRMEDAIDKVQCVDEKIQVVMNGAQCAFTRSPMLSDFYTLRWKAMQSSSGGSKIDHSTDNERHRRSQVFVTS
jgi:hypothetical protein